MKYKSRRNAFPLMLKVTHLRVFTVILIHIRFSFRPLSDLQHSFDFLSLENWLFRLYFEDAMTYFRFPNKSMHLKQKNIFLVSHEL